MSLVDIENILAAKKMYLRRIEFLQGEIQRLVKRGLQLGEDREVETMAALDEVEEELNGINDGLGVLNHLLKS